MVSLIFRIIHDDCPNSLASFMCCLAEYVKKYSFFCSDGNLFLVIHPDYVDNLNKFFEKYNVVYEQFSLVKL